MRPALALMVSSGFAFGGGFAHAAIYKFVDEHGVTNFTNIKPDSRYRIIEKSTRGGYIPAVSQYSLRSFADAERAQFEREIGAAARANNLDPALLHAVISVESGYNRFAESGKGAIGLMQLTMDTAIRYGVSNRFDPMQNVLAGARYLHDLLGMFHNDMQLALAAYNAGENAVVKYGNHVPPYRETIDYVPRVLTYYKRYRHTLS